MELYQLEYFRSLCKYGSYTKAARECDVTQPAMTTAIKKLEAECGAPLIDRSRKSFSLTPIGETVLHHAENIHTEIQNIQTALAELNNQKREVINIAFPLTLCPDLLFAISYRFIADHPEILVLCSQSGPEVIADGLDRGIFDIGISCVDLQLPTLEYENFRTVEYYAFFSEEHEFNHYDCITPEMLADQDLLLPKNPIGVAKSIHAYFSQQNACPNCVGVGNIIPSDCNMLARQGAGVALLPKHTAPEHRARLCPPLMVDLGIMWRKGKKLTKNQQKLIRFLHELHTE